MSKVTRDAMYEARPERRPFVLTRSSYLGGQRYAATWTGDNVASWDHLRWSVSMVLNLGLSGQPTSGPDIGGFAGTPSPELYAHWIGLGAFLPFCRTHHGLKGDQEPWSFGAEVEEVARAALHRRYRLLPYLYTLFHEAATTGLPVSRPLFFADPADPSLRHEDRAFLLGRDLLVQPVLQPGGAHVQTAPPGNWRPFTLVGEDPIRTPAHPILRLRAGAILPVGPGGESSEEAFGGPLTLLVSLDDTGRAVGRLYEDAGDGLGFRNGDYRLTTYEAVRRGERRRDDAWPDVEGHSVERRTKSPTIVVLDAPGNPANRLLVMRPRALSSTAAAAAVRRTSRGTVVFHRAQATRCSARSRRFGIASARSMRRAASCSAPRPAACRPPRWRLPDARVALDSPRRTRSILFVASPTLSGVDVEIPIRPSWMISSGPPYRVANVGKPAAHRLDDGESKSFEQRWLHKSAALIRDESVELAHLGLVGLHLDPSNVAFEPVFVEEDVSYVRFARARRGRSTPRCGGGRRRSASWPPREARGFRAYHSSSPAMFLIRSRRDMANRRGLLSSSRSAAARAAPATQTPFLGSLRGSLEDGALRLNTGRRPSGRLPAKRC